MNAAGTNTRALGETRTRGETRARGETRTRGETRAPKRNSGDRDDRHCRVTAYRSSL